MSLAVVLRDADTARHQVVAFYKRWFDTRAAVPQLDAALNYFTTSDFVTGAARRAESIVEPLMINCQRESAQEFLDTIKLKNYIRRY